MGRGVPLLVIPIVAGCGGIAVVDGSPPDAVPKCTPLTCPGGTCGTTIEAKMDVLPEHWSFNGSASHDGSSQTGVLTPIALNSKGTILYANAIATDSFNATFEVRMSGGTGADGIGFMIETDGNHAIATSKEGGDLGMAGLHGFGVEFDTYDDGQPCDVPADHVAVDSLAACGNGFPTMLGSAAVPKLSNSGFRSVRVQLSFGVVSVSLDGAAVLSDVPLPGFTPGQAYYFGFSGATGGGTDLHEVRNIVITFPTPRCL
jgi:hypothetical protein